MKPIENGVTAPQGFRASGVHAGLKKNPENLEQVKLLLLRPSEDLGDLASQYEPQLPSAFRFMTRGWGTQENQSTDMLSLVMFQPDYLQHLIEMGEKDAEARMDEIHTFLCSD